MSKRVAPFVLVGLAGFVVQIAVLAWLARGLGWSYELSTVIAVETAMVQNFWWHRRWTWRDRMTDVEPLIPQFLRFQIATGSLSLGGNLVTTIVCVEGLGLPVVAANAVAVIVMSLANYSAFDRWVFVDAGQDWNAATVIPAVSRSERRRAASSPTPGVSPCRQMV